MDGSTSEITFHAKKLIEIVEVQKERIILIRLGFITNKIILI